MPSIKNDMHAKRPLATTAIRKILIVGPSWIGDMMMAQALFKRLKQRNPEVVLHLLASDWTRPLVAAMPEIDQVISMPLGHGQFDLATRYRLGRSLMHEGYDQAILLPNSLKSAFIPFFARIPLRTGWRGEMRYGLLNDIRKLDKSRYPLMVQRYLALGYEPGAPLPEQFAWPQLHISEAERSRALAQFNLTLTRPLLILCPGAEYGPAKRWPENYFATLAAQHIRSEGQVWLLGSAKDAPVAEQIREQLPPALQEHAHNLAGRTALGDALALMSCATAVVSNDSGLMHIAAALNRPLVVIFGSTSPEHTPPLAKQVRIVRSTIDCSPCFERHCPLGHHKCMQELPPAQVQQALNELLASHQGQACT